MLRACPGAPVVAPPSATALAPVLLLLLALGASPAARTPPSRRPATPRRRPACRPQTLEEGRALFLRTAPPATGSTPRAAQRRAEPDRRRCGVGRLPGRHRPDAGQRARRADRGEAVEFITDEQIAALAAYVASLGPGPAIPSTRTLDYADADIAAGRRDLPHQLRHVPQLRRLRRGADPRQVRALAEERHAEAHLRGHADRAAVDAGVRRRHDDAGGQAGRSSATSRPPRTEPVAGRARARARSARSPRARSAGWSAWAPSSAAPSGWGRRHDDRTHPRRRGRRNGRRAGLRRHHRLLEQRPDGHRGDLGARHRRRPRPARRRRAGDPGRARRARGPVREPGPARRTSTGARTSTPRPRSAASARSPPSSACPRSARCCSSWPSSRSSRPGRPATTCWTRSAGRPSCSGLGLGLALFCIGAGAIHWAKTLMPDDEVVSERKPMRSTDEDRAEAVAALKEGAAGAGLGRRKLIRNSLLGAMAPLGLLAIIPLRDLGPLPGASSRVHRVEARPAAGDRPDRPADQGRRRADRRRHPRPARGHRRDGAPDSTSGPRPPPW